MHDENATLEHQHEATIKALTEESLRAEIAAGQSVNAMSIAAGMCEAWSALGADLEGRPAMLQACARYAQERITAIRAELRVSTTDHFDPKTRTGYQEALRRVSIRLVRIMPADVNGIIFPSDDDEEPVPFKVGDERDSRLIVTLREGAKTLTGDPFEVRSWNLRRAYHDVICAADPVTVEHAVFSDEDRIEGVALSLPWGAYRPESIYTHAEVVHDNEQPGASSTCTGSRSRCSSATSGVRGRGRLRATWCSMARSGKTRRTARRRGAGIRRPAGHRQGSTWARPGAYSDNDV